MVDRGVISPERARQLQEEWQEITGKWILTASQEQIDEWATTFAPDHPEWFQQQPRKHG